jgi:hypothetical protein
MQILRFTVGTWAVTLSKMESNQWGMNRGVTWSHVL